MLLLQFSFIGVSSVSRSSSSSGNSGSYDFRMISSSSLSDELSVKWGKRFSLFAVCVITLDFYCRVLRQTGLGVAFGYGAIAVKMLISCRPLQMSNWLAVQPALKQHYCLSQQQAETYPL